MSLIDCPSCGKKWDTQQHYACECGAWFSKNAPRNLAKPNAQPPLSEVLAEIDKKAFWDYIPRRSVPMKEVEEVLRKYFA